jgi:hypothetical protein
MPPSQRGAHQHRDQRADRSTEETEAFDQHSASHSASGNGRLKRSDQQATGTFNVLGRRAHDPRLETDRECTECESPQDDCEDGDNWKRTTDKQRRR